MEDQEISLSDIIGSIKRFFNFLKSRIWVLIFFVCFFISLFIYLSKTQEIQYEAKLDFVIETQKSSNPFGFAVPSFISSSSGDEGEHSKMMKILDTRNLAKKVFLKEVLIDESQDLLANHYVTHSSYLFEKPISFNKNINPDSLSLSESGKFKSIHLNFLKNSFIVEPSSEIISMIVTTPNESLSLELVNSYYNAIQGFYRDELEVKNLKNYQSVLFRTDSLKKEVKTIDAQIAYRNDSRKNIIAAKSSLYDADLIRRKQVTESAYLQSIVNLEQARFAKENSETDFSIIESPYYPLKKIRPESIILSIIKGFVIGLVLSLIVLFIWKFMIDNVMPAWKASE